MTSMRAMNAGILALLVFLPASGQTVIRNRDEGTASIPASNVMGNGNITAYIEGGGTYDLNRLAAIPAVGAQVGITDIMELSARFVPWTGLAIGPIEVHLQITTPANDKLRFFGAAVFADLYLSTSQDTLSATTASGKPEYNSYPEATLVADLDWLALFKWLPFKTYFKVGMVDNPDLLFKYDQLAFAAAAEWKTVRHGLFVDAGLSLYKEKPTKIFAGDASYTQRYAWVEPGARFRFLSRFSLVGSMRVTLFQELKPVLPLNPELFAVSFRLEAPIFFKETNTEAIRTLIFQEQAKEKRTEAVAESEGSFAAPKTANLVGARAKDADTLGTYDFSKERDELIKRREETQEKMAEIEKLFSDLDKADSLKMQAEKTTPPAASDSATRQ